MTLELRALPRRSPLWTQALPVLQQLRTTLDTAALDAVLADGSVTFLGAFEGDDCVGVAGWRIVTNTSAGRKLYVDDLVAAASARSRGVGSALLAELASIGRANGCRALELDSGVNRFAAHRFYLRERMDITAHHFALPLIDAIEPSNVGGKVSTSTHGSPFRISGR